MLSISAKDWFLLLFGAICGVLADRTIGQLLLDRVRERWRRWRRTVKSEKAMRRLQVSGELVKVGHKSEYVFIHQFSPVGFDSTTLHTKVVDEPPLEARIARLPDELRPIAVSELADRIERERQRLEESPTAWNEDKLGLSAVYVGREPQHDWPTLTIHFHQTDYATFRTFTGAWQEHVKGIDLAELLPAERLREVQPGLSHSFGVNATVVTADRRVLLTKRSVVTSSARPLKHISVNEGMRADDLDDETKRPDPYKTLMRGIREEIGIDATAGRAIFHTIMLDATRYQWALLGHVDLSDTEWDAARVLSARAVGRAIDNWETDRLRAVPFTLDDVLRELEEPDTWIAHGWVNLLLSAMYSFTSGHDRLLTLLTETRARRRRDVIVPKPSSPIDAPNEVAR